jgi:hypothetical protein
MALDGTYSQLLMKLGGSLGNVPQKPSDPPNFIKLLGNTRSTY